jgi:hypothetical protein
VLDKEDQDVDFKPIAMEYKFNQDLDAVILLVLAIMLIRYLNLVKEVAIFESTLR